MFGFNFISTFLILINLISFFSGNFSKNILLINLILFVISLILFFLIKKYNVKKIINFFEKETSLIFLNTVLFFQILCFNMGGNYGILFLLNFGIMFLFGISATLELKVENNYSFSKKQIFRLSGLYALIQMLLILLFN